MQTMYEIPGKVQIEEGIKDLTELISDNLDEVKYIDGNAPQPDEPGSWSPTIAHRVDLFLLEQVLNRFKIVRNQFI